jgi:hypothetical protein
MIRIRRGRPGAGGHGLPQSTRLHRRQAGLDKRGTALRGHPPREGEELTTQNRDSEIPKNYRDLLDSTVLAHVATIGPHGEPQNNPVWFDWDGEHVKFSQTKARQKSRNLNGDPRIALSIVDPENPYRYLEVRGEVTRVEEDSNINFISAMAKKYMGVERYPYHLPSDERVVVFVKPRHTTHMGA